MMKVATAALVAALMIALAGCTVAVSGRPVASAPTTLTPAPTSTAPPDRTELEAALLPRDTVQNESLVDPGSAVTGRLLINCTAAFPADNRLGTAVQRWWDGDGGGTTRDFEAGDVTVRHVVATYDGLTGPQVVDQARTVVGTSCRTYVSRSGSTWQLDREVPASWPGVTSWGYCLQVVAPAERYGYVCTSYAARGDVISQLTVSVTETQRDPTKATTSKLFDDLAARAASRLPTS